MGWLSGWDYRRPVTLSRASGAVTDYQMKLLVGESAGATGEDVDCNSHCNADFSDLRFTTSDGQTLLDYWIESITGSTPNQLATIWIEFDLIGTEDTTFYMYYGKADAPAVSNGVNTFIKFENFEWGNDGDSLDTGGNFTWTIAAGASKISTEQKYGGTRSAKLVGAAGAGWVVQAFGVTDYTMDENSALMVRIYKENATANFRLTLDLAAMSLFLDIDSSENLSYLNAAGTAYVDTGADITPDAWQLIEWTDINTTNKTADLWLNGNKIGDNLAVRAAVYSAAGKWFHGLFAGTVDNDAWIDNIIIRNWRATEPAWGSWGEESLNALEAEIIIESEIEGWHNWLAGELEAEAEFHAVAGGFVSQLEAEAEIGAVAAGFVRQIECISSVRAVVPYPTAPTLTGRKPAPDQTYVRRNQPVQFELRGHNADAVDLDSVSVEINGAEYKKDDPEFTYSGDGDHYEISVSHPIWGYEQKVDVTVNASSVFGMAMQEVQYSFYTEWASSHDRIGRGKIEIYEMGKYDFDILTIQEDWIRQGMARETLNMELWYGRYMKLPAVEDIEIRAIAGDRNALGKEILSQGYFNVKVGDGSYVKMYEDTVIHLGPMYANTHKDLSFKLSIPEAAETKRYVMLELEIKPKMMRTWGRFPWGVGIYASDVELYNFHPSNIFYRAYVFDAAMWGSLEEAGIVASPFYRGEDKQW